MTRKFLFLITFLLVAMSTVLIFGLFDNPKIQPSFGGQANAQTASIEKYGNVTYGDRTRPLRMFRPISGDAYHKVSVSFKAPKAAALSQVLLFWIYKSDHYAQGDGGRYMFELRADDGSANHAPGSQVLSQIGPLDFPFRDAWAWWPLDFAVDLEQDQWYHVIFWNVHESPSNNYASYEYLSHEQDLLPQGLDWAVWTQKNDDNSPWVLQDNFSSDYGGMEASVILRWQDNAFWGQGYISAQADPPRPKIYGSNYAGEFFIADQDRIVENISIRVSKIGNPQDNLYIKLESENGQIVFEDILAQAPDLTEFDPYDGKSKKLVTLQLNSSLELIKDTSYRLVLSSPSSNSESHCYVLGAPIYSSTSVSGGNINIPHDILTWQGSDSGYLITSSNAGNNWNAGRQVDASFYFSHHATQDNPNITLTKSAAPDSVQSGDQITYTIHYSNTGQSQAKNVIITDNIPTGTTYFDGGTYTGGHVSWSFNQLDPGAQGDVSFRVRLD